MKFEMQSKRELISIFEQEDIDKEIRIYLSNSYDELKEKGLPYIYNLEHLAELSDVSHRRLEFYIFNKPKAYCSYLVKKKKGGYRKIDAPCKDLKKVQRWILDYILYSVSLPENVHGFVPERSIFSNAEQHTNQDLVVGIDIKDFFPTITKKRVFGLFKSLGYTSMISSYLSEICTFESVLPQGSPSSPMIANLICRNLDNKLSKFCDKKGYIYTRYADDITISGENTIPKYIHIIFSIIHQEGFDVNADKTRVLSRGSRQKVTGLVVNDKVSIPKKERKRLEAIVHNIQKNGPLAENKEKDPFFKQKLTGKIEHVGNAHPDFANELLDTLGGVDWEDHDIILKDFEEDERRIRDVKKSSYAKKISYNELGFFQEIKNTPSKELLNIKQKVCDLNEKCSEHSKEGCENCLYDPKVKHKKCLKHIFGHFIKNTSGPHHGHEIYDSGGFTEYEDYMLLVAFIIKSRLKSTAEKNSLITEYLDLTGREEIDVYSIASSDTLDNKSTIRIKRITKFLKDEKYYCLVLLRDICDIYYTFISDIDY